MAYNSNPKSDFRGRSEVIVPLDAVRFLEIWKGKLYTNTQDCVMTDGLPAFGGGRHIPPDCIGIIRTVKTGKLMFHDDKAAFRRLRPHEQCLCTEPAKFMISPKIAFSTGLWL